MEIFQYRADQANQVAPIYDAALIEYRRVEYSLPLQFVQSHCPHKIQKIHILLFQLKFEATKSTKFQTIYISETFEILCYM